jgi:hypothetical protein
MVLGGAGAGPVTAIPALLAGLCDDAALFPPGNAPLDEALPAHFRHREGPHANLVGAFVFPAPRLSELAAAAARYPESGRTLTVSLTSPGGTEGVPAALGQLRGMEGVALVALEIAVPIDQSPAALFDALDEIASAAPGVELFVEVPRDGRRPAILAGLAGTPHAAKFRTGGVVRDAYPDETELAAAIAAVADAEVRFKATAGLHHAIRNTDPDTGFEQHGFLNVMLATHRAAAGASEARLSETLAERDGARLAADLAALDDEEVAALRAKFLSFGTCSISEPLTELIELGLISRSALVPSIEGTRA